MASLIIRILGAGVQFKLVVFLGQWFRLGQYVDGKAVVVVTPLALGATRSSGSSSGSGWRNDPPMSAMKALHSTPAGERSFAHLLAQDAAAGRAIERLPVVT
jgi:hypothetical protein